MNDTADSPSLPGIRGSVALVTGASGGVGGGIATAFARAGAQVVLHYHHGAERARTLADQLTAQGYLASTAGADLCDTAALGALFDDIAARYGRLDHLVNNAGIQPLAPLKDMTTQQFDQVWHANTSAVFACTQQAARIMAPAGGGTITHIASIEATQPAFAHAHYCTAKAGLIMHARCAALEYGPDHIRVNTVSPGLIDPGHLQDSWPQGRERWLSHVPLGRTGTPADIGQACVFLASQWASWITGTDLVVDGGISAHPTW